MKMAVMTAPVLWLPGRDVTLNAVFSLFCVLTCTDSSSAPDNYLGLHESLLCLFTVASRKYILKSGIGRIGSQRVHAISKATMVIVPSYRYSSKANHLSYTLMQVLLMSKPNSLGTHSSDRLSLSLSNGVTAVTLHTP